MKDFYFAIFGVCHTSFVFKSKQTLVLLFWTPNKLLRKIHRKYGVFICVCNLILNKHKRFQSISSIDDLQLFICFGETIQKNNCAKPTNQKVEEIQFWLRIYFVRPFNDDHSSFFLVMRIYCILILLNVI